MPRLFSCIYGCITVFPCVDMCVLKEKDVRADLPNGFSDLGVLGSSGTLALPPCSSVSFSPFPFFYASLVSLTVFTCLSTFLFFCPPAIAPDFSQNLLKAQTLARQGGDVLIECKPRMSPRGMISWRKGKEALRESHR